MKELIKITEQNGKQAVSARELHKFLESAERFSKWFERMISYGFIENIDYQGCTFWDTLANQELTDYALTIDTAKEISMLQRSEKGKQARQYFIDCEKKLKQGGFQLPQTFAEALKLAALQAERLELQSAELQKQAPKVAYFDEVLQSESTYNTNQIAKELGTSAVTLNKKLQEMKVQYKQGGTWLLYHKYQDKGYTKTETHTYTDSNGQTRTSMLTVWTEAGRLFIHELFKRQMSKTA
ncbi:phage antirepressor KilAC domain-containing protein [Capnocytophaga canis]|uniref:phage antirepressor KilAC domain-containing protein n=1 Tax=Capnocytophaga canis TaxID=1848903 RepID=UPI0037CE2290